MLGIGGGDIPLELASDPDNMKKIIYICIVKKNYIIMILLLIILDW